MSPEILGGERSYWVVLADREEAKRILREENVAIMCSYHLMHFIHDEEPFAFLK